MEHITFLGWFVKLNCNNIYVIERIDIFDLTVEAMYIFSHQLVVKHVYLFENNKYY